jgi:hypothetical protein
LPSKIRTQEYIVGKDDFEYAKHTNRTDDLPLKDAKFNKAIQSKETLSWEETLCNASRKKVFTIENSLHI